MSDWGVALAQPQRHRLATDSLRELGVEYFLPKIERMAVVNGRHYRHKSPLLGRYIPFIITDYWRAILSLRGISGMLLNAEKDQPALVKEDQIEAIKAICVNGVYREPIVEAAPLVYGQRVTPKTGPLHSHVGRYDGRKGKKREAALFMLFGREQRITFKKGELVAA